MLRQKKIIEKLKKAGATSVPTAKTLAEAGVFNPEAFRGLTKNMVSDGILGTDGNNRYYIK